MITKIIDNNGIVSLGNISNKNDLNSEAKININPPPGDGRCQCCGKHISELTPFEKTGDPLVGDFEGELLVKNFRRSGPNDDEASKVWDTVHELMETFGNEGDDPYDWIISIYGKEKGEQYCWSLEAYHQIGKSWECRDCIVLDEDEYFAIKS